MKRSLWILSGLLLIFLLSACGAAGEKASATAASVQSAAPPAAFVSADRTEDAARLLTDEEVLDAYDRAVTAFGWFTLESLPCGETAAEVDGHVYQKVDYAGLGSMEALKTYLRGIFSEDVVRELTEETGTPPVYRDVDGALYELPFRREADPTKGEISLSVEQTGDTAYQVNVAVKTLSEDGKNVTGVECWAFPYERIGDRWVFTDFSLVY